MRKNRAVVSFLCAAVLLSAAAASAGQDLKPEEILEKHIAALGGRAKLAAVKNRIVAGASSFESKLPSRRAEGKALISSDDENLMFIASFASREYPIEKIGFFKNDVSLPWVTAGTRSPLGAYLADHKKVLSDGLFTGAISSNWALLNLERRSAKLNFDGIKKVDGRKVFVLDYLSKGIGSQEFSIRLFFDAETFHHIRTEYRHEISAGADPFGTLGRQAGVRIALTEMFGDFRTVEGLTFPYRYRAAYRTESNSGTYEYEWGVVIGAYNLNQNLAADFFKFQ